MGPAQIGWQIDVTDYALVRTGLPANGTAYRFTLARPYAEYRMDEGSWNGTAGRSCRLERQCTQRVASRITAEALR